MVRSCDHVFLSGYCACGAWMLLRDLAACTPITCGSVRKIGSYHLVARVWAALGLFFKIPHSCYEEDRRELALISKPLLMRLEQCVMESLALEWLT